MIFVVGGGGGGLSSKNAVLIVTFPVGSTVTATKGTASLKPTLWTKGADSTLECAIFSIPASKFDSTTPWTVTATDGTNTASTGVLVDDNSEYEVILSYHTKLFWDGYVEEYPSNVFYIYPTDNSRVKVLDGIIHFTGMQYDFGEETFGINSAISLTEYKTFYCEATGIQAQSDRSLRMVVKTNSPSYYGGSFYSSNGAVATQIFTFDSTRTLYSIDISSLTGNYYLGIGGCGKADVFRMYLSKN